MAEDIAFQYDAPYEELDADDQRNILLDHFFKGDPKFTGSAEDMRIGLEAYRSGEQPAEIKVGWVRRGNRSYRVIRDAKTGKIRQWVD